MFQKLTPEHVEATMLAFAMSLANLSNGLIPKAIGLLINQYFKISNDDMSDYYKLKIVIIFGCLYELLLVRLIPTNSEIKK